MISIIMLTYNREEYVGRMIESVLAQTYTNFEYIIVDNGSSDKSGVIAEEYAARDQRIRVIHRERGNIGSGRNAGLDAARGDYIAFVDDDDYLEPTFLEYLHNLAIENNADIAVCGSWREINGQRSSKYIFDGTYHYSGEEAVREMLKRDQYNSATPTKLFAKNIFEHHRFSETAKYDDIELTYRLFATADRVAVSGVPQYTFVRHAANNSQGTTVGEQVNTEQIKIYLDVFQKRTRWLSEKFPKNVQYWLYTELSYILSMYEKSSDHELKEELIRKMRENADAWSSMERYYSDRDQTLTKQFEEVLYES